MEITYIPIPYTIYHIPMRVKLNNIRTLFNSSKRGRVNSKRDLFKVFSATLLPCKNNKKM